MSGSISAELKSKQNECMQSLIEYIDLLALGLKPQNHGARLEDMGCKSSFVSPNNQLTTESSNQHKTLNFLIDEAISELGTGPTENGNLDLSSDWTNRSRFTREIKHCSEYIKNSSEESIFDSNFHKETGFSGLSAVSNQTHTNSRLGVSKLMTIPRRFSEYRDDVVFDSCVDYKDYLPLLNHTASFNKETVGKNTPRQHKGELDLCPKANSCKANTHAKQTRHLTAVPHSYSDWGSLVLNNNSKLENFRKPQAIQSVSTRDCSLGTTEIQSSNKINHGSFSELGSLTCSSKKRFLASTQDTSSTIHTKVFSKKIPDTRVTQYSDCELFNADLLEPNGSTTNGATSAAKRDHPMPKIFERKAFVGTPSVKQAGVVREAPGDLDRYRRTFATHSRVNK
ncbi:uncharacterized protein KNAG_0A06625 [Huiozyma naganishii CBS 8797]|uniref:Uncharacterized protein n=1 Tax=Huiozyma naganishii (strain ATCC MYA-139 / BCRC 22969 / CBS 8797 / KCTC 17520 / NBRC 10181 / NCYC 3082 / Yp74L-3) TaxID=1071383 RepID=J7S2R6_HUIN7|nr:hypothetical protein KNAG_0A06625 [Kazachstania naganishii CBS 8797]CCK68319.1 hypothetical protein KNAG_0A06625 [Kazachstania naganishii CBS 8797]